MKPPYLFIYLFVDYDTEINIGLLGYANHQLKGVPFSFYTTSGENSAN